MCSNQLDYVRVGGLEFQMTRVSYLKGTRTVLIVIELGKFIQGFNESISLRNQTS